MGSEQSVAVMIAAYMAFILPTAVAAFGRGFVWQFLCFILNVAAVFVAFQAGFWWSVGTWLAAWVFAGVALNQAAIERRFTSLERSVVSGNLPTSSDARPTVISTDSVISARAARFAHWAGVAVSVGAIAAVLLLTRR